MQYSPRSFWSSVVLPSAFLVACASSTADTPADAVSCARGEELIDGECRPISRDTGRTDLTDPDLGTDMADATIDVTDTVETGPSCGDGVEAYCRDDDTAIDCQPGGVEIVVDCEADQTCIDGVCTGTTECEAEEFLGCHDDHNERVCSEEGEVDIVPCPEANPNCITAEGGCTAMAGPRPML